MSGGNEEEALRAALASTLVGGQPKSAPVGIAGGGDHQGVETPVNTPMGTPTDLGAGGAANAAASGSRFNFDAPAADGEAKPKFNFAAPPPATGVRFNFDAPPAESAGASGGSRFNFSAPPAGAGGPSPFAFAGGDDDDDDEEGGMRMADMLMNNPDLMAAIENQLGSLIGKKSGYLDSLPGYVQKRVRALRNVQKEWREVEKEYLAQERALQLAFEERYATFYERRAAIIKGEYEPTDAEAEDSDDDGSQGGGDDGGEGASAGDAEAAADAGDGSEEVEDLDLVGVPGFWLNCLIAYPPMQEMITEDDEDVLKHLVDLRSRLLTGEDEDGDAKIGFALDFTFSPNKWFDNTVLTKTYHFAESDIDQVVFQRATGTVIEWKDNMCYCSEVGSFFDFFDPPDPSDEDLEEMDPNQREEIAMVLESDYSMGEIMQVKLIPRAVLWFTGEALADEEDMDINEYLMAAAQGFDDEDGGSGYSDDEWAPPPGETPSECKQS